VKSLSRFCSAAPNKIAQHRWAFLFAMIEVSMDSNTDFSITSMPESRPADYYLRWFGGSIFLDFDDYRYGQIRLKRISFDGFGRCDLSGRAIPMSRENSRAFKHIVSNKVSDQPMLARIIRKTIDDNRNLIWEDALRFYHLW
jgi:hypothetical protein